MGLATAARWFANRFTERSGIATQLDIPDHLDRLSQSTEVVLFRVLQESLTNVHRHSGSRVAKISMSVEGENIHLTVMDHGRGFGEQTDGSTRVGVGIAGMRERVRELGGEFRIDSTSRGTTIHVTMPLREKPLHAGSNSSCG